MSSLDRRRLTDDFERVRGQDVPAATPPSEWRSATQAWAKMQDERHWQGLLEDKERERLEDRDQDWTTLLVNTEFMDENEPCPATVAALLLFGRNVNRYLPQAGIDAVAYSGSNKDYEALERAILRGPMAPLMSPDGHLVEPGLVEQGVEFVRRNVRTVSLEDGVRRQARWDYPPEVIREAIVNALVHRDYLLAGSDIELSLYSDRLEIVSPGRLANGITPDRMRTGCRSARNQLLKDVMRDYGYLEHMGMGAPRKIVRGMREHNCTEPDLSCCGCGRRPRHCDSPASMWRVK